MQSKINTLCLLTAAALAAACAPGPDDGAIKDCADCPELVVIPAGSFLMGTAVEDRRNDPSSGRPNANEEPQHEVTIAEPFALGKYEVTYAEFAAFVAATGYEATQGCIQLSDGPGRLKVDPERNWRDPGFAQAANDPVVCISLDDANAYTAWLSEQTSYAYYIPSEAQWEYAAKAGTTGRYFWGDDFSQACNYANVNFRADPPPCDDGFPGIAPVGQFQPNAFGLYDTISNVWEWTPDCGHKNYVGAPTDGSAWIDEDDCLFRMIRSGGVRNDLGRTTHVVRAGRPKSGTAPNLGMRVARSLKKSPDANSVAALIPVPAELDEGSDWPTDSEAGELFAQQCAACHINQGSLKGVYGTDRETIRTLIDIGGNNIMSMPAFRQRISQNEIDVLTDYVMQQKGWE